MDVRWKNKDVSWVGLHLLTKATNLSSSPLRLWQKNYCFSDKLTILVRPALNQVEGHNCISKFQITVRLKTLPPFFADASATKM